MVGRWLFHMRQCDGDAKQWLVSGVFFDSSALLAWLTNPLAVLCARAVLAWPGPLRRSGEPLSMAPTAIRRLHLPFKKPSCRRHPLDAAVQRHVGGMDVKPDTDLSSLNLR